MHLPNKIAQFVISRPYFMATLLAAAGSVISAYKNAPSPVVHAVQRLSDYTGIPLGQAQANANVLRVELSSTQNARIGAQGYTIHSSSSGITISANSSDATANGVYTLLRTLMIEHRKDPFSREWNVEERPAFPLRSMQVAPYRFGASYGFAALSPDRWSFEQWKQYVDFMRLCNMTNLAMGSARVYDPRVSRQPPGAMALRGLEAGHGLLSRDRHEDLTGSSVRT